MTRQMTPMQDPANMPLEVICHVRERKQESIVYQFQSIEILQAEPPPILPIPPIPDMPVEAAAVPVDVAKPVMLAMVGDITIVEVPGAMSIESMVQSTGYIPS